MGSYQIETYSADEKRWTTDGLEASCGANRFGTEAEAEEAIESLQALGDEWAEAQYRVRCRA